MGKEDVAWKAWNPEPPLVLMQLVFCSVIPTIAGAGTSSAEIKPKWRYHTLLTLGSGKVRTGLRLQEVEPELYGAIAEALRVNFSPAGNRPLRPVGWIVTLNCNSYTKDFNDIPADEICFFSCPNGE